MKKLSKLGLILAAGALPAVNATAGIFVFADDACPVDKGGVELHVTAESAMPANHSKAFENAAGIEIAVGAAENLELAASLGFSHEYISHHYAKKVGGSRSDYANCTDFGVSAKYQIADPEKNPVGIAFVADFGYTFANADRSAAKEYEFGAGVNFEKDLLDGDLILVACPGVSLGRAKSFGEESSWTNTSTYSLAAAASYQLLEGFRVAIEATYEYEIVEEDEDDQAFYVGPAMSYEGENWLFAIGAGVRTFSVNEFGSHDVVVAGQLEFAF